jgi:hypothetical protein
MGLQQQTHRGTTTAVGQEIPLPKARKSSHGGTIITFHVVEMATPKFMLIHFKFEFECETHGDEDSSSVLLG